MEEYIITFTKEELEEIVGCIGCYINDRCCGGEDQEFNEKIMDKIEKRIEQIEKFKNVN